MSFFTEDEDEVTRKDPIPVIHHANTLTIQQDLRYKSLKSIISSIQGYPMTVDYYSSVLGQNDDPRGYSLAASPIHAQYRLIRNMELKVESPVSHSQDGLTKQSTVAGTANVYPVVTPNTGDVFIADIGDGRRGLYQVTSVESLSFFKDAVSRIQYELLDYLNPQIIFDLNLKTVKILHWRKDFIDYGQNPLVEDEVIQWLRSLEQEYSQLQETFFKVYYSNEYDTILVPGQSAPTYDPYLTQTVLSLFMTSKTPHYTTIRRLNVEEDIVYHAESVFDAIAKRDIKILDRCIHRVGLTESRFFDVNPLHHSVRYSGIKYVVYPSEGAVNVDAQIRPSSKAITKARFDTNELAFRGQSTGEIGTMRYDMVVGSTTDPETGETVHDVQEVELPLIHPINHDDYYIFSEAFYLKAETGLSLIEVQVLDYLRGRALNPHVLAKLCSDWPNWGVLEKFYYLPILLMLLYIHVRQI